ncbi:zinc finger protein 37 isoform X2 [Agrilus planipennis]|uniref:Zinc finger protein 37 isoform X2 n=1 Tax=Agrilus planipennis TaxID=224129 RepID=A0A7F5R9C5_AGRPL|nr:zinc finger protein 37 isoform X2 [Agrilus planipennis]
MVNSVELMQLCRLCLVKDEVNIPIFDNETDVQQIFLKISTCLPVKVTQDDNLPKKICNDCSYKLDLCYQFWNTSANSEKQLVTWLNEVGLSQETLNEAKLQKTESNSTPGLVLKQETIEPESESSHEVVNNVSTESQEYILQQQQLPYQTPAFPFTDDNFVSGESANAGASKTHTNNKRESTLKRKRQAVATVTQPDSDDDVDEDIDDPTETKVAKTEETSDDDRDDDGLNDEESTEFAGVPSTSTDNEQPGPSGIGKNVVDAPLQENSLRRSSRLSAKIQKGRNALNQTITGWSCSSCFDVFSSLAEYKEHKKFHKTVAAIALKYEDGVPHKTKKSDESSEESDQSSDYSDEAETESEYEVSESNSDSDESQINKEITSNKRNLRTPVTLPKQQLKSNQTTIIKSFNSDSNNTRNRSAIIPSTKTLAANATVGTKKKKTANKSSNQKNIDSILFQLLQEKKTVEKTNRSKDLIESGNSVITMAPNTNDHVQYGQEGQTVTNGLADDFDDRSNLPCSNTKNATSSNDQKSPRISKKKAKRLKKSGKTKTSKTNSFEKENKDESSYSSNKKGTTKKTSGKTKSTKRKRKVKKSKKENKDGKTNPHEYMAICPFCDIKFKLSILLRTHLQSTHEKEGPFKCAVCFKECFTYRGLEKHFEYHHVGKTFKCYQCKKGFDSKEEVVFHRNEQHRNYCDICQTYYNTPRSTHNQIVHAEEKIKCTICDKTYKGKTLLALHMRRVHSGAKFPCSNCGNKFKDSSDLKRHFTVRHSEKKITICQVCGKVINVNNLKSHLKGHGATAIVCCKICKKSYKTRSGAQICQDKHSNFRRYKCMMCDKAYFTPGSLIVHKRLHTGEKPYSCSVCNRSFYTQYILYKHSLSHRSIKKN